MRIITRKKWSLNNINYELFIHFFRYILSIRKSRWFYCSLRLPRVCLNALSSHVYCFLLSLFIACILNSMYAAGQLPYAARKQLVSCLTDFGCFSNTKIKKLNLPEIKRLTFLLQEIIPWVDNISHWAQKHKTIKLCRPNKGWKLPTKRLAKT